MTIKGCVNEDSAFSLMARVSADGSDVQQADVSSISWEVFNAETQASVSSGSLTVSDVVFDTLQTNDLWSYDGSGYNFRHQVAQSVLTSPGRYRFEHLFTLSTGNAFFIEPFVVTVNEVWTS